MKKLILASACGHAMASRRRSLSVTAAFHSVTTHARNVWMFCN
ncbi:hypothetical protein [Bradyrhizobium guangxiense]|nr:hypothetical protein [Bradyrhizobium guangxiense]